MFAVPYGTIAALLERTPAAAKMLASRARRRVQGSAWPGFSRLIRGPRHVAAQALAGARLSQFMRPVLVNQAAGAVIVRNGRPFSVIAFTVTGGKITEIDVIADPDRLHHIAAELINGSPATTASSGP